MKGPRSRRFPCTDAGNAELLAALYREQLLFDHARHKWLIWRNHWWMEDIDGRVLRMAKIAARWRYRHALNLSGDSRKAESAWAFQSESRYRMSAALACATSEKTLADAGRGWDTNPLTFGVGNGVVDLQRGNLRSGRPEDRISLHSDVLYDPTADCPRFKQFLSEIFDGRPELMTFIQRAVGYTLTGSTSEQCVFLCFGDGSNGKTTLFEALRYVLGEYSCDTPFSTFELKVRSSIPNDVAALKGRRLVTASETNESVSLNDARIKALSGGDAIPARFLYQELFNFRPVAKFWLAFNHKPPIRDDSHGMWRRIRLIPFRHRFEENEIDKKLLQKLQQEGPGILNWAIQGCVDWQAEGLKPPREVTDASSAYREECDIVGQFVRDHCIEHPAAQVPLAVLYNEYLQVVNVSGDPCPLGSRSFNRRLEVKGFRQVRVGHNRTRMWQGLCRNKDAEAQKVTQADGRPVADGNSGNSSTPVRLV